VTEKRASVFKHAVLIRREDGVGLQSRDCEMRSIWRSDAAVAIHPHDCVGIVVSAHKFERELKAKVANPGTQGLALKVCERQVSGLDKKVKRALGDLLSTGKIRWCGKRDTRANK
jgi:hypothetical protein